RAHMTMDRYKCSGWLFVMLDGTPYTDISISDDVTKDIEQLKDLTVGKVSIILVQWIWKAILKKNPTTDLTQKQVYACWAHLHESTWWLDNECNKSLKAVINLSTS
ncbi:hypothetical protein L208DRAFT_1342014, partial [Tricholoma matsutake]